MLDFDTRAQIALLEWVYRGGVKLFDVDFVSLRRLLDIPMDLADATLVVAAEQLKIREIISIASDFDIYRTTNKEHISNIFQV